MDRTRRAVTALRRVLAPGLALALAASALAPAARAGAYDLYTVDLEQHLPGGGDALIAGANASGQVLINALDAGGSQRAFLWQLDASGEPELTPIVVAPGDDVARVITIDDAGRVIGVSGNRAFVWTRAEGAFVLPPLAADVTDPERDERVPVGITASGEVAGWSHNFWDDRRQAVLWRRAGDAYVAIPIFPEAPTSEARTVNVDGLVVGTATFGPSYDYTQIGFVWDASASADPIGIENPVPESEWLEPIAVNADGVVIGLIADPDGGFVGFVWEDGATTIVVDPGEVSALTDHGHVLGADPLGAPLVWLGAPPVRPIVGLGGPFVGVGAITSASADRAFVTGLAWTSAGVPHAYRWDSQDGVAQDLFGGTCGVASFGLDVAADGAVLGGYATLDGASAGVFVTSPAGLLGLNPAGAASALPIGLDEAGGVYGSWRVAGGPERPFVALPADDGAAGVPLPPEQPPVAVCQDATVAMAADGSIPFDPALLDGGSTSACALSFAIPAYELAGLHLGSNLVTLVVSDPLGRSDTCTATVTVIDPVPPIITCPEPVAATTPSGQASMAVDLGLATAIDNAGQTGLTITSDAPGDRVFAIGDHTVTWTATDGSGNPTSCTQAVAIGDGGGNLFCKAASVTLDATHTAALTPSAVFAGTSPGTVVSGLVVSTTTLSCDDLGAVVVTLTGTRADGSAASCQAIVTVADIAPTAVCRAAALTVSAGSTALDPSWVDRGSIAGCGTVTVTPGTFSIDDVGARTVAVVATNGDGASASCEAPVSVLAEGDQVWDVIDLDPSATFDVPGAITVGRMDEAGRVVADFTPLDGSAGSRFAWQIVAGVPTMTRFPSAPAGAHVWDDGSHTTLALLPGDLELGGPTVGDEASRVVVGASMGWSTVRATRWAPPAYTPEQLSGDRSEARGVVASGWIYGIKRDPVTLRISGTWSWSPTTRTTTLLPNPPGRILEPAVMSASGVIVGTAVAAVTGSGVASRAFVWRPGDASATLLPFDGSRAQDVDAAGRVSGASTSLGAFVWHGDASAPTLLGALPTRPTYLTGDAAFAGDRVWGNAYTPSFQAFPFVVADGGGLAEPFAQTCVVQRAYAYDANTSGTLTGPYHAAPATHRQRGYVWAEGVLAGLELPGALEVLPLQVNEAGWVLGHWWLPGEPSVSSHGPQRAFVARPVTSGPLLGTPSISLVDPGPTAVCGSTTVALGASGTGVLDLAGYLSAGSTGCITSYTASRTTFGPSDLGPVPVTLTVTDALGRQASCTATVNVVDTTPPTITDCAPALTIRADPGATTATALLGQPLASDNVGVAGFTNNAPSVFPLGTTTVRWQAVDASGNTSGACLQSVTVLQGDPVCQPAWVWLSDGVATLDPAAVYAGVLGGVSFTDLAVSPSTLGCDDVSAGRTVTLTGTRDDGKLGSCQAHVTVVDASEARCRSAVVALDADGTATLTPDMVDGGTNGCGTFTLSQDTFDEDDLGPTSVTLTYTNASGDPSSCTASVYVFGALEADCEPATVDLVDGVGVVSPGRVVTTTMDPYVVATVTPSTFGCADIGTRAITVDVVDALGRTTSCTTTVEVGIAAERLVASDLGVGVTPIARDDAGRLLFNRDGQAWIWDAGVVTQVAPGFMVVEATGMNRHGAVVGTVTDDTYESRAFVTAGGALALLSDPGEPSFGTAINDAGQAVGYVFGDVTRAFVWQAGARTFIDPDVLMGATAPIDINEAGQVVGYLDLTLDAGDGEIVVERHAFSWGPAAGGAPPALVDLGLVPDGARIALAESGQIMLAHESDTLVWRPGDLAPEALDAGMPTASFMQSPSGRIVGYDVTGAAFTWSEGARTALAGTGGYGLTVALDVNAGGDVVGLELDLETFAGHVLLWPRQATTPTVVAPFQFGALGELAFPRIGDDGIVYGVDAGSRAWAWRAGALSDLTPPAAPAGALSVVLGVDDGVAWGAWGDGAPTNGFVTRVVSGVPTLVAPATVEATNALGTCAATPSIATSAFDACGPATITWSGHVEGAPFPVGTTALVLTATGASGLTTSQTVHVTIEDDEAPVVTPTGGDAVTFDCATPTWSDPGATVVDNCDAGLVAASSGAVDIATPGLYTLSYVAADASGNVSLPVLRTVRVSDGDGDGTGDCQDGCPSDAGKVAPGLCGCGATEASCADACPHDPLKSAPGVCGCGVPDNDTNGNGTPDCLDVCATGPVLVSAPGPTILVADACVSEGGGHHGGGCGGGQAKKSKKSGDKVIAVMPSLVGQVQAVDTCGGAVVVTQSPPAGAELEVGTRSLTFTIRGAGGTTIVTRSLTVVSGLDLEYQSPLDNDETRAFTIGQTVPVKVLARTPCGKDVSTQSLVGLVARLEVVELDERDPNYLRHINETQPNGQPATTLTRNGNHFQVNLATPRATFTTAKSTRYFRVRVTVTSADGSLLMGSADAYLEPRCR